jgi:hypothetical protein
MTNKDDSSYLSPDMSKKRMTMVVGSGLTNIVVGANSGQTFTSQMNMAKQSSSVTRNKSTSVIIKD